MREGVNRRKRTREKATPSQKKGGRKSAPQLHDNKDRYLSTDHRGVGWKWQLTFQQLPVLEGAAFLYWLASSGLLELNL